MNKISVIIPAYNEAKTIAGVLNAVTDSKLVDEIIVINDGSSDLTSLIAAENGALLIDLSENMGKGNAVSIGLSNANGEIILMLDADLIGLNKNHIKTLVDPVIVGDADMSIGIFKSGGFWTTLSQQITPFLSGQRAFRKNAIAGISKLAESKFGVETAISLHFKKKKYKSRIVLLENLTHVVKEKKMGVFKGFLSRLKMYRDILYTLLSKE